jgi:uncharacterized DUF497 family protein
LDNLKFDWDEQNSGHIAQHDIAPPEAEQVLFNRPIDISAELRNGEERIAQVGETDADRILVVVSTRLADGRIRVVTAWPAKERLRRYFTSHKEAGSAGRTKAKDIRQ